MKSKSEAHHIPYTLFTRYGVPNVMVMDNTMGQTAGYFKSKARDEYFHTRTTEHFPPWMKLAELGVREANKGVSQKMMKRKIPKVL